MAIPIETLVVQLRADVKGLQSGLARATKTTQTASAKMSKSAGTVGLAFKSMLAPLIGIAGVTLAIRKLKGLADSMDRLAKLSVKIGVDVGALSELEFVAERSGIAFRSMAMALQRSSVAIAEAAEGTGEAKQAIEDLELSAKDLIKIPIDKQLEVIADAFLKVKNDSKRSQLAVDIFGARGAALLQAMRTGGKGIREIRKEARDFNLTIGKKAAEDAETYADSVSNLGAAFKGMGIALTSAGLPALIAFVDKLTKSVTAFSQFNKDVKLIKEEQERLAKINEENSGVLGKLAASYNEVSEAIKRKFLVLNPLFKLTKAFVGAKKEEANAIKKTREERIKALNEEAERVQGLRKAAGGDGEDGFFKKFTDGFEGIKAGAEVSFGDITRTVEINTQAWSDAFADQLLSGKQSFQDFRDFAISAINDIVREMFKAAVVAPLVQGLTKSLLGFIPGGQVAASAPASGGAGTAIPGTSLGSFSIGVPRAEGGDLDRGQTAIIGEKGPELFVPKMAGTVIPNGKFGGGGGVNITQNFNISPGLEETVQAKIEEAAPFIAQSAKTAVFQAIEKGGGASRSVGRRA